MDTKDSSQTLFTRTSLQTTIRTITIALHLIIRLGTTTNLVISDPHLGSSFEEVGAGEAGGGEDADQRGALHGSRIYLSRYQAAPPWWFILQKTINNHPRW